MSQLTRMYCSSCGNSIYNTFVGSDGKRAAAGDPDAVRVPIVHYIVTGQPGDTGPLLDSNGEGVRVTSFTREITQVPTARVEFCEICFAETFGLALVTAEEDPMHSTEQVQQTAKAVGAVVQDAAIDEVHTNAVVLERPLLAIQVGRGAAQAPTLPPARMTSIHPE